MFTAVLFIPTENSRERGTGREDNLPPRDTGLMYVQDGTFHGWEQSGFRRLLGGTEMRSL